MKSLLTIVAWCLLFVVCWPLALAALVLWPLVWLLSLPFRILSISFEAVFALLKAVLFLPARMLGRRPSRAAGPLRFPPCRADTERRESMVSAQAALALLLDGNRRFVQDVRSRDTLPARGRRLELASSQARSRFAVILGCSDSRVPVEIVFDQGLGDLFVIRVAGNIVAPSQIGSVEFAAEQFGTRLVVVLGHSNCGAIAATLQQLQRPKENQSRNLRSIVDLVRPSVENLLATDLKYDLPKLFREAVRANIRASAVHLRHGSEIIENLIQNDGLMIVGAEYSLETGEVDFFDGIGEPDPADR